MKNQVTFDIDSIGSFQFNFRFNFPIWRVKISYINIFSYQSFQVKKLQKFEKKPKNLDKIAEINVNRNIHPLKKCKHFVRFCQITFKRRYVMIKAIQYQK